MGALRTSFVSIIPGGSYLNTLIDELEFRAQQEKIQTEYKREAAEENLKLSQSAAEVSRDGNRKEIAKCKSICASKLSLLRLASRFGIHLEEGALSHDLDFIKQMIIARARHNINGFISFAKEHPGLGLDRALQKFVGHFADGGLRQLVANDAEVGSIHLMESDTLSLQA